MDVSYKILGSINKIDGVRPVVATVVVADECIAERRKSTEESGLSVPDADTDIAFAIFEERYESALNNAGYTYEQAVAGGFDFEETVHT